LRNIDDPRLRRHLADVLTTDYSDVGLATMQTRYRTDMRLVIPNDIQNEIRTHCGDRLVRNAADQNIFVLPADCRLALDPSRVAAAARLLRAKFSRKRASASPWVSQRLSAKYRHHRNPDAHAGTRSGQAILNVARPLLVR
jgi:hypothetical protein